MAVVKSVFIPAWVAAKAVYHTKDDRIRSHVMLCWLAFGPGYRTGDWYDLAEGARRNGTPSFRVDRYIP